jgi:hypothetical protein
MLRAIDYHDNNGSGIICSNCSFGWIITDASIMSISVKLRRWRRRRETIYLLSRSFYLKVKLFFVYIFWSHSLNINQAAADCTNEWQNVRSRRSPYLSLFEINLKCSTNIRTPWYITTSLLDFL